MHPQHEELLSVLAASKRYRVAPQTLYNNVKSGKLPSVTRSGKVLIREADVRDYVHRRRGAKSVLPPQAEQVHSGPIVFETTTWEDVGSDYEIEADVATEVQVTPIQEASSPSLSDLRTKISHELAAVKHQFSGISADIERLEERAKQLIGEEERFAKMLAKVDELEEFSKSIH